MISRYRTFIGHWPDYKNIAEKTRRRGVELRLITDVKELTGDFLQSIKWGMKIGSFKVKLVPSVLTDRIVIADKKEAYISVSSDSRAMQILWSDNADFVNIIQKYFDILWLDAKEVTLIND